jgi:hypothetical protein
LTQIDLCINLQSSSKKKPTLIEESKVARYKKESTQTGVIGMLYIVDVSMSDKGGLKRVRQKLLLVGCEEADIERKIKWIIDGTKYNSFTIKSIVKVREKVHVLSTVYKEAAEVTTPTINRDGGTQVVPQGKTITKKYEPKLFSVGLATTMIGEDEKHALRKIGNALIASASDVKSHSAASLSEGSTLVIEEIALSSGYSKGKDVSAEINNATFVRG